MNKLAVAINTDWYNNMAEIKIEPAVIDITMPMAVTNSIDYIFNRKDGTPIDITSATLLFTVKNAEWDSDSSDSGAKIKKELSITDGVNGKAKLFLTQQETFIDPGEYYYDIKITQTYVSSPTIVDIALKGIFTIIGDSTNRVVGIA